MLIPSRLAIRLQDDGWWVRKDIILAKRAPMPESCEDRPTSWHEHLFLLTRAAKYFYDKIAVAEPSEYPDGPNAPNAIKSPYGQGFTRRAAGGRQRAAMLGDARYVGAGFKDAHDGRTGRHQSYQPTTRNMRDVWWLSPEPLRENHYASYPTEIPRRAILAGTSERGVCPKCGAPWERIGKVAGYGSSASELKAAIRKSDCCLAVNAR